MWLRDSVTGLSVTFLSQETIEVVGVQGDSWEALSWNSAGTHVVV